MNAQPQFNVAVNTGGNPRKLATIGRFAWVTVLCCCLAALVGVMTGSDSFALMATDREKVFWFLVAAGGLAAGDGMLLHSHGSWKARLGLFFVAGFAGAAAAGGPAAAWRWRTAPPPVLALGFALWGGVLGSWYGQLRGHPRLGGLLGFLLLGAVAGMALVLDHPDPATGFGLVVGLLLALLVYPNRTARRAWWVTRVTAAGVVLAAGVGLLLTAEHYWLHTRLYVFQATPLHATGRYEVAFSPDGRRALSSHSQFTVLWRVEDGQEIKRIYRQGFSNWALRFSAAGHACCVTVQGHGVAQWHDLDTEEERVVILEGVGRPVDPQRPWDNPFKAAVSQDGRRAAVVHESDNLLWVIDLKAGRAIRHELGKLPPAKAVAWWKEDHILLSCGHDRSVHLVSVEGETLRVKRSFPNVFPRYSRFFVPPRASLVCVISPGESEPVLVWDGRPQSEFHIFHAATAGARCLAFSPDERRMLIAHRDGTVRLWDADEARELRCYYQHRSVVLKTLLGRGVYLNAIAFSPDGRLGLSSQDSGEVRLWELGAD